MGREDEMGRTSTMGSNGDEGDSRTDNRMPKIDVGMSERILNYSSSKGNQRKWYSKGKFIKMDT